MINILCFGNPLHGDDGFGHAVYKRLAEMNLPSHIRIFDTGTSGLNAMNLFSQCNQVIIIDAIASRGEPGRLHQLSPDQVNSSNSPAGHGQGVAYLLQAIKSLETQIPQILVLGVEVMSINPFQPGLSEPVERAVDTTVRYLESRFATESYQPLF